MSSESFDEENNEVLSLRNADVLDLLFASPLSNTANDLNGEPSSIRLENIVSAKWFPLEIIVERQLCSKKRERMGARYVNNQWRSVAFGTASWV